MYEAQVVHHIPGRMRIKAPFLRSAGADSQQISQLLAPLEGLKQVNFSPITGSVLLHYDPEIDAEFTERLTEHVQRTLGLNLLPATEDGVISRNNTTSVATSVMRDIRLTREIYSFFNRINHDVKNATDNVFDLKSLVPIGLAGLALVRAGSAVTTPLWVTLGIFSFTSFAILNPVSITVETEDAVRSNRRKNRKQKFPS